MGEKWPKNDHIPPHFYFGAHIPPPALFGALSVVSCSFPSTDFFFRASVLRAQELGSSRGVFTVSHEGTILQDPVRTDHPVGALAHG